MKIGPSLAIESVARSGPDGPHHPSPEPMNKLTLPLLVTLGVATAPAFATQATWTTMGSGNAMDMSADGTAVSGSFGGNAFVWTQAGGQVDIGESDGRAVSLDGSVVGGNMTDAMGDSVAGRWTQSTGWVSLGGIGGQSGTSISTTYGMSGDGNTIAGLGWINAGNAEAFRWTMAGGMTQMFAVGPNSSRANGVSEDGTWIAGWDEHSTGPRLACIWDSGDVQTFIASTSTNPDGLGEAWGFSENNTYVAGSTESEGFVWDAVNGLTKTGALPSTDFFALGEAYGVSNDGDRVVGFYRVTFPFDNRATIWTPTSGIEELKTVLEANGATGVPNLTIARAISADGTRILATDGFVWGFAHLPADVAPGTNYCLSTMNSTGASAGISATGSNSVSANDLVLTASNMPDQPGIFIAGPAAAQIPFFNGFLCIDQNGLQRFADQTAASGGVITEAVDLATSAPGGLNVVAGSSYFYQRWYRDPAAAGGNANFTDGLEVAYTP